MVTEEVTLEGHLIDSDILRRVFARVVEGGGEFEVLEFKVGRTNLEPSFTRIAVKAPAVLYSDLDLLLRTVRDLFTPQVDKLIVDNKSEYERLLKFVGAFMPQT